jgi:putative transposase
MARMARAVMPGVPHLVTQRGNRRQKVFFGDGDYAAYKELLAEGCKAAGVEVWAYCLMPNHVHLMLLPGDRDGLRAALGETHRRYTRLINERKRWTGYLWAGRFASFAMDEAHVLSCAAYVEQNPVRARLAERAKEWRWSSARAHLKGRDDGLVTVKPLLSLVNDWGDFLSERLTAEELEPIRKAERTGRPLGDPKFIKQLERRLGRTLAKQKPGPKPKGKRALTRRSN